MANPTRPKDAKPRAEGDEFEIKQTIKVDSANTGASLLSVIAIVVVAVIITIATNYFFIDVKLSQMSKKMSEMSFAPVEEAAGDEEEGVKSERGIILDLGEFILNLSDVNNRKFLKVNVAIELSKKDTVGR